MDKKEELKKKEETVDVFDTLSEKQKTVVYALIGQALEEDDSDEDKKNKDSKKEDNTMKHNVFDQEERQDENVLSHSDMEAIFSDVKRYGSLRDAVLAHGIEDLDYLFPDANNVTNTPQFIQRYGLGSEGYEFCTSYPVLQNQVHLRRYYRRRRSCEGLYER